MAVLGSYFTSLGWTRDDAKWFWLQIVTVATLISSNVLDLPYWAGYLGIPLSTRELHWVQAITAIVLWVSARSATSALPGKGEAMTVNKPFTPPGGVAAVLVVVALSAMFVGVSACGQSTRHIATVTVLTEHSVLAGLQDLATQNFCGTPTALKAPACIDHATRLKVDAFLSKAFDEDQKLLQVVHDAPANKPADTATLVGDISTLVGDIIAALPSSLQAKAEALLTGGK